MHVDVERVGDLLTQERAEAASVDAPDDLADEVSEERCVLTVACARRPPWLLALERPHDAVPVVERLGRKGFSQAEQPGLVSEQPAHAHLGLPGLREGRPVPSDRCIEVDLSGVDESKQTGRSEGLRHGVDVHDRLARPWLAGRRLARPEVGHGPAIVIAGDGCPGLAEVVEGAAERLGDRLEPGHDGTLDLQLSHVGRLSHDPPRGVMASARSRGARRSPPRRRSGAPPSARRIPHRPS